MFFGKFPYRPLKKNAKCMKEAIINGKPEPDYQATRIPGAGECGPISPQALRFCKALLSRNPHDRPTPTEALDFSYIEGARSRLEKVRKSDAVTVSLYPMIKGAIDEGAFSFGKSAPDMETEAQLAILQGNGASARSLLASAMPECKPVKVSMPALPVHNGAVSDGLVLKPKIVVSPDDASTTAGSLETLPDLNVDDFLSEPEEALEEVDEDDEDDA
jgi:hypothetical protein